METNTGSISIHRDAEKNYQLSTSNEQIFRSLKMNMDEEQLELTLRINQVFGNHFKVELENQMITVNLVANPNKPRMATRTILLPCSVEKDSMTFERIGNLLTIRFKRDSTDNYLFNWQTTKTQKRFD